MRNAISGSMPKRFAPRVATAAGRVAAGEGSTALAAIGAEKPLTASGIDAFQPPMSSPSMRMRDCWMA